MTQSTLPPRIGRYASLLQFSNPFAARRRDLSRLLERGTRMDHQFRMPRICFISEAIGTEAENTTKDTIFFDVLRFWPEASSEFEANSLIHGSLAAVQPIVRAQRGKVIAMHYN